MWQSFKSNIFKLKYNWNSSTITHIQPELSQRKKVQVISALFRFALSFILIVCAHNPKVQTNSPFYNKEPTLTGFHLWDNIQETENKSNSSLQQKLCNKQTEADYDHLTGFLTLLLCRLLLLFSFVYKDFLLFFSVL